MPPSAVPAPPAAQETSGHERDCGSGAAHSCAPTSAESSPSLASFSSSSASASCCMARSCASLAATSASLAASAAAAAAFSSAILRSSASRSASLSPGVESKGPAGEMGMGCARLPMPSKGAQPSIAHGANPTQGGSRSPQTPRPRPIQPRSRAPAPPRTPARLTAVGGRQVLDRRRLLPPVRHLLLEARNVAAHALLRLLPQLELLILGKQPLLVLLRVGGCVGRVGGGWGRSAEASWGKHHAEASNPVRQAGCVAGLKRER